MFSNSLSTYVESNVNNSNNDPDLPHNLNASSISYSNLDFADPKLWNSNLHFILLFGMIEKSTNNIENIIKLLNWMTSFINKRNFKNHRKLDLSYLEGFIQVIWNFLTVRVMNIGLYFIFLFLFSFHFHSTFI